MYVAEIDKVIGREGRRNCILSVCVEPTNRCPGRCPYCLIENHKQDPSTEDILGYLRILSERGVERISWGGGEPLLRKDIYHLGRETKDLKMGSLLRTSGVFPVDLLACRKSFDWVDLSLDSINEQIFSLARPGIQFDSVKNNIKALSQSHIRLRVNVLLTKLNSQTMYDTIDWIVASGVQHLRFLPLVKRGRAIKNWNELYLHAECTERMMADCLKYAARVGLSASRLETLSRTVLVILKPDGQVCTGDPTGQKHIGHISDGGVFDQLKHIVGAEQDKYYATTT